MKNLRNFFIVSIITLFVLCAFAPSAALLAQQQQEMSDNPTTMELEQFRGDLLQVTQQLNSSVASLKRSPLLQDAFAKLKTPEYQTDVQELNARTQKQLQAMTYEELTVVYRAFNQKFPKWREAPQAVNQIAEKINGNFFAENRVSENKSFGGTTSKAITPDNCQDAFSQAPSWTDWAFTKGYEIAAMAAYEVIPEPLNGIAMAAWVPLAEGVLALETLNNIYDRCSGDKDNAEILAAIDNVKSTVTNLNQQIQENDDDNASYIVNTLQTALNNAKTEIINNNNSNKTDIVNNDNQNRTTITTAITNATTNINNNSANNTTTITNAVTDAKNTIVNNDNSNRTQIINNDNSNKDTIINNDNSNRTQIINNANQNKNELGNMLLRTQIEMDLRAENVAVVAWFMTPTANGGHLDFVQQIVTETLANLRAANRASGIFDISLEHGQRFLEKANAEKTAGKFRLAYDNYRRAYQAVVNQNIRVP